jgi:peptidoglycan hydrolase CwlO-like protein
VQIGDFEAQEMAKPSVASLYNDLQAALGRINALEGEVNEICKGMALKDERITKLEGEIKKKDETLLEMQKPRAEVRVVRSTEAEVTAAVERHDTGNCQ